MGKVEENKEKKRNTLLDTAFALFTAQGIAKTSISDIVERAGVAKGTFYLYFRDKYDIQEKLISFKASQMFKHALAHSGYEDQIGFENKLIVIVDDILNQMKKNPELLRFINKNLSWGIFKRALIKTGPDENLSMIEKIIQEEGFTGKDTSLMLYTIVELVGSTSHSIILESDPVSLEVYKPHLYNTIRAIIKEYSE